MWRLSRAGAATRRGPWAARMWRSRCRGHRPRRKPRLSLRNRPSRDSAPAEFAPIRDEAGSRGRAGKPDLFLWKTLSVLSLFLRLLGPNSGMLAFATWRLHAWTFKRNLSTNMTAKPIARENP